MNPLEQKLLGPLNEAQREAVVSTQGPVLVLAGAGSGKTRVITHRLAWLVEAEGLSPDEIMAVTFTNKAAGEMRQRAERLLGGGYGLYWIGTFHSLCVRILRREGHRLGFGPQFVIYDSDDQLGLIKTVMRERNLDEKQFPPRQLLSAISRAKNEGKTPDEMRRQWGGDYIREQTATLWREYQSRLKRADAMDFDDILLHALEVLSKHDDAREHYAGRFRQMLVDEYQDTNDPQYRMIKLLTSLHKNLCAVGDEDQSIYRWRGATIENILKFEREFPGAKTIRLEQNYRSTQNILDAALAVVGKNRSRLGKNLFTDKPGGDKITAIETPTGRAEAEWVARQIETQRARRPLSDFAILYRTNAQSRPFEEIFISRAIPYQVIGGQKFYERREVRDLLAYARLALNPADDLACKRIINVPTRGIGKTTLEKLEVRAAREAVPLLAAIRSAINDPAAFTARAANLLREFIWRMDEFVADVGALPPAPFFEKAIADLHYFEFLEAEYGATGDHESRIENVNELITGARAFAPTPERDCRQSHSEFLERYALASDQDSIEDDSEKLTLMTVHSAKGLEFPVVFIVGLEQSLFPHARAAESEADLEEERRLFYVAVTRARERLCISRARYRSRYGGFEEERERSVFWDEVPAHLVFYVEAASSNREQTCSRQRSFGGGQSQYENRGGYSPRESGGSAPGGSLQNASAFFGGGESALPQSGLNAAGRPVLAPASAFRASASSFSGPGPVASLAAPPTKDPHRPGARVQHQKFGHGVILYKEGAGDDSFLTISFSNYGRKKLAVKFAGLKFL